MDLNVPETGFEPARLLRHTDLNRARLPIPPPGHYYFHTKKVMRILFFPNSLSQGLNF